MLRTILVPLDGSPFAEQALPYAAVLARKALAELCLVHVLKPLGADELAAQLVGAKPTALDYLKAKADAIARGGLIRVRTAVLEGPVAETLCGYADCENADLIVATTHGHGILVRFWLGSVSDRLVRTAPAPVLTVRPTGTATDVSDPAAVRRVLVPLDGSPFAEQALPLALRMADLFVAELALVRVVEPVPTASLDIGGLGPALPDTALIAELESNAGLYLDRIAEVVRRDGQSVKTCVAVHGSPARAILDFARPDDLIVLQTHGRGGGARLLLGSVADKVLRGAPCPVVTKHPEE
jgi:nucleotide-binding universal stress UspA family protein